MPALNYHHLRLFHAIATHGGLTAAARALHLSPSALSVQLGRLEDQLGHRLFDREGRRLVLTEAGRIALDYAATVFEAGHELLATLRDRPATGRRALRVGAQTTLSRNVQLAFVGPVIADPEVELVLRSGTMEVLLEQLNAHALDVVLASTAEGDPVPHDAASTLDSVVLDEQPISLVGRPRAAPVRYPEDLVHIPLLLPSQGSPVRRLFDTQLARAAIRPVLLAEVDDAAMLRLLARASDGLTLVPPVVVRDELQDGTLVEHVRVPGLVERFHAITARRRFPNPLLKLLLG